MNKKFHLLCFTVIISILSSLLFPLSSIAAYNQTTAQSYLLAHANNPWSTMGLSALEAQNIPSDYLKNVSGTKAVDFEAPILAITSLNQDPRTFGNSNLVDKLKSFFSAGQIGDPTTLNDDVFGILALSSAGVPASDAVVTGSKSFLMSHQNVDGGWSFSTGGGSDSNTTAGAIAAVVAAGVPASDTHIQNALNYLKTAQSPDGGFAYDPKSQFGTASDSSSTAWVMWALVAAGINPASWVNSGHSPADYLTGNQTASGLFRYQSGAGEDAFSPATTGYAVVALSGKTLPLKAIPTPSSSSTPSVNFRIEGSGSTVCSGTANAANAMDIIKTAADVCNFTYNIKQLSFGPYLDQVNADSAAGSTGWLYLVNNSAPSIGAADYKTKNGDNILWYFGGDGWQPLQISLSADSAGFGQTVTATVQAFLGGAYFPLAGATVYFGTNSAVTNSSGQASVTAPDGYYKIYAQKTGYIRSNSALLKIGQPSASSLSLTAIFSGGQIEGTSTPPSPGISFSVDASNLDFGNVTPGTQKSKNIKVINTGDSAIKLSASVSGDSLFTGNLSLNNIFWQNFTATVDKSVSQTLAAGLKIPAGFSGSSGQKSGQMILWATGQ